MTNSAMCAMYQSLDHLSSLLSEFEDDSRDVHHTLCLPLLQDMVYDDECPCPTNTSTAEVGPKHLITT